MKRLPTRLMVGKGEKNGQGTKTVFTGKQAKEIVADMSHASSEERIQGVEEDPEDPDEETADRFPAPEDVDLEIRTRRLENVLRRMSSSQTTTNGSAGPVRRGRRRAVTTSDHKTCALVQTRLKLGDIM
ncbi:unnamed protein product [Orchesella dallaii]|uniref:Uncharacterized protein n=1 Tax=Orchesella dallaii TaxID=48710 RepID=A0ABP1S5J8_9HEXA